MEIAQKYVKSLPKNLKKEKTLHRITGQSGSGKTTQIMKSLNAVFEKKKVNFCHIAVRNFSKYHPNYIQLEKTHKKEHLREKTNGFALKCLTYVLKYLLEAEFLVVLEITLLSKDFENLILKVVQQNNYKIKFHMLAVSPKISNLFIKKRNLLSNSCLEEARITYNKSVKYFNKEFLKTFAYLSRLNNFDSEVVLWNVCDTVPCFFGNIKNSRKSFYKNRKIRTMPVKTEQELCNGKIKFYTSYL